MNFHYAKRKHGIIGMCKFSKRIIEFSRTPKVFYSFIHMYKYIQEITVCSGPVKNIQLQLINFFGPQAIGA